MSALTGAFILEPTDDGSFTFFSEDFGEWFHSRAGAYTEARMTYVEATALPTLALAPALTILDVCYGLGYNTAAALEAIQRVNPHCQVTLVGLELDARVPRQAIATGLIEHWDPPIQSVLSALAADGRFAQGSLSATLLVGDARQTIQTLVHNHFQADVVFFDPFSPPHCPELWTVDFMRQVAHCLHPRGRLVTYSCAAAVRTALHLAGFEIAPIAAAGRRWPGTLAQFTSIGLAPLSPQEQEHLLTRAAVPYRDPTLRDDAETIRQRRQQEQAKSALIPTSHWRKQWLPPYPASALN